MRFPRVTHVLDVSDMLERCRCSISSTEHRITHRTDGFDHLHGLVSILEDEHCVVHDVWGELGGEQVGYLLSSM